jgi:hypothetical protein
MAEIKDVLMVIISNEEHGLEIKFCDWSVENEENVCYVNEYEYDSLSDMIFDFKEHTKHIEWFNKRSSRGGTAAFVPPVNWKIVRVFTLVINVE